MNAITVLCEKLNLRKVQDLTNVPEEFLLSLLEQSDRSMLYCLLYLRDNAGSFMPQRDIRKFVEKINATVAKFRKRLHESATLYHYYGLSGTPYPNAGSYGTSHVKRSRSEDVLGPGFLFHGAQEPMMEDYNGAIQHYWWYSGTGPSPYPWSGSYRRKKKKDKQAKSGIEDVLNGEDPDEVVDELLS